MTTQHQKYTSDARVSSRMSISARKLAATLWELQEISLLMPSKETIDVSDLHPPNTHVGQPLPSAPSPASSHVSMRALRRSSVKCRFGDRTKRKPPKAGQNAAAIHKQVLKLLENPKPINCPEDEEDTHEIEVDDGRTTQAPSFIDDKAVAEGDGGSTTSSELLKVLNQVWALEELQKSSTSVVSTLQSDLEKARLQVKDLTIQQLSHYRDMETLNKQLTEEKAEWQEREQEKTRQALQALREDLEDEKKSKRKLDLLHRRVAKELSDVKRSLMKTLQELERERKARELMEDVCDELAREVGEDKARVEELKRESVKVREEVEEERKMLQVAEVWREERVQMKLAEARLEIEEKNTALDKLRMELDAFLRAKRASSASQEFKDFIKVNSSVSPEQSKPTASWSQTSSTLVSLLNEAYEAADEHRTSSNSSVDGEMKGTVSTIELNNDKCNEDYGFESTDEEDNDGDAVVEEDEDLHSLELNKDSNENKDSYKREVESSNMGQMKDVSYMKGTDNRSDSYKREVESSNMGQMKDVSYMKGTDNRRVSPPRVKKPTMQGGRQGSETMDLAEVEAVVNTEENRDRVKKWNFELDFPWRTEAKEEKIDTRVLNEDSEDGKLTREGENPSLDQDEPKNDAFICIPEKDRKLLSESNGVARQLSSTFSFEAVTNGVWSLQNLGSSRELEGVSGVISKHCASPTRKWGHSLSSTEPVKPQNASSAKPTNAAQMGGPKAIKEKIVKGKVADAKGDSRQPRFRLCKAL